MDGIWTKPALLPPTTGKFAMALNPEDESDTRFWLLPTDNLGKILYFDGRQWIDLTSRLPIIRYMSASAGKG